MENNPSWLLPLLPSRATGALLALLYLHPDRDYTLAEAGRLIAASPKVMHTEADRLVTAGLVRELRRGRARLLSAETASPVSRPLTDLLAVTYGPLPALTDLLSQVQGVVQAYIYGSWAARYLGEPGSVPHEGLRPTSRGGHIAPYVAVSAQLDPPMGQVLKPFDRMRRTRNRSEYPSFTTPEVTPDNVRADVPVAASIVQVCESVLDEMSPF